MVSAVSAAPINAPAACPVRTRWTVSGKFFRDAETGTAVFVKAVTWGPFPPGEDPNPIAELRRVRDELGANALRVYETPDRTFLDTCASLGLRVFIGFAWAQHVDFLHDRRLFRTEQERFRHEVSQLRGHPAVAGWLVANEIPAPLVRWMGPHRVNRALEELIRAGREADPGALFAYANYPSTEYLSPRGQDFIAFNLYLEDREAYARYLRRLQHQAGNRPLLVAETGLDSGTHGESAQADALAWQIEEAALAGASGAVLFAWSDRWYRGGERVEGWHFGLTRSDGSARPALHRVSDVWRDWQGPADALKSKSFPRPRMSIVVCTYRGARLLRPCLESLRRLDYPDRETIVVNDGGDADVAAVLADFPEARVVNLSPHGGLSAARNAGARAATGEIIVYTDDDCEADPDWLMWLAYAFETDCLAAAGGPNIPPPPADRLRALVAAAPGGPAHVLIDDLTAEHLPGCNLAVRREVSEAVGGFDERFWTAGDDVDFCWRLIAAGHRIGFHPAAMVWHHRRFTVKAYLKQQLGYGRAEAMLMPLYPGRFGLRGGARWRGRIYLEGPAAWLATSGSRIYHGLRGLAPYQMLYGNGPSHSAAALLLDWTWMATAFLLIALGMLFAIPVTALAGAAMAIASVARAWTIADRAEIATPHASRMARVGIALLALAQGPMRSARRSLGLLQRREPAPADAPLRPPAVSRRPSPRWSFGGRRFAFWSEEGIDRETWLHRFESRCQSRNLPLSPPPEDSDDDVRIGPWHGWLCRVTTVTEYHEKGRTLIRVGVRYSPTRSLAWLGGSALAILGLAAIYAWLATAGWSGQIATWAVLLVTAGFLSPRRPGLPAIEGEIQATARDLGLKPL
ncbi:MAG: glycosyltransferase [Verrucomicrobiales bacterium]|nr:glycosyltransferase [Verrucomicrobiales bacterium]